MLSISCFFGPDKIAYQLNADNRIDGGIQMPFHGIISRGLLNKLLPMDPAAELWNTYAPFCFDENYTPEEDLSLLKKYMAEAGVLSFAESTIAVINYLNRYCLEKNVFDAEVEIWNVKEGHTSSVWKITIASEKLSEVFAVNVGRDKEASAELAETSMMMQSLNEHYPGLELATPLEIITIRDEMLPTDVVVTRNQWVKDAYEIHSRKNRASEEEEFLIVERFITDEKKPAAIRSVLGRICNSDETEKISSFIKQFVAASAGCLPKPVTININDGDIVWDGNKAVVVALS